MPRKKKFINNVTRVRTATGLSQSEFARLIGVTASLIKKLEDGKRTLSQEVASRICAETGALLIPAHIIGVPVERPIEYSKADYEEWKREMSFDPKSIRAATRVVCKLIEIMMAASVRPGLQKSAQVFNALVRAIERVKDEFRMEKHIEAELRDRKSTVTELYNIGTLRRNLALAKKLGFQDDPKLNDQQKIPLTRTIGWMPTEDLFNIALRHKEVLDEALKESTYEELRGEQLAKLNAEIANMQQDQEAELERFLPKQQIENLTK